MRGAFAGRGERLWIQLAFVMIDGVVVYFVFVVMVVMRFGFGVSATVSSRVSLFVSGIGFDVGAFGRAQRSDFFDGFGLVDTFVGNFDFVDDVNFFRFFGGLFFLFLVVLFFFECGTADDGVG